MCMFGQPANWINSQSDLINYLGAAWLQTHHPLALMYLSRAEAIQTSEELDELCDELGV